MHPYTHQYHQQHTSVPSSKHGHGEATNDDDDQSMLRLSLWPPSHHNGAMAASPACSSSSLSVTTTASMSAAAAASYPWLNELGHYDGSGGNCLRVGSSSTSSHGRFLFHEQHEPDASISLSIAPPISSNELAACSRSFAAPVTLPSTVTTVTPGGSQVPSQYWIPSAAEILAASTQQFSCAICNKTFKRFNNMQSQMHMSLHGSQYGKGSESLRGANTGTAPPASLMRLPCYCCAVGCQNC